MEKEITIEVNLGEQKYLDIIIQGITEGIKEAGVHPVNILKIFELGVFAIKEMNVDLSKPLPEAEELLRDMIKECLE